MRTPSSALPFFPHAIAFFFAATFFFATVLVFFLAIVLLVHRLILGARRVFVGNDPDVDHRRLAGLGHHLARLLQRGRDLRGLAHFHTPAAPHLREDREIHVAKLVADTAALGAVLGDLAVADLVHRRVVADHGDVRRAETIGGFHVERRHAEGTVAVVAEHFL